MLMRIDDILSRGQEFLRSDKGKNLTHAATDAVRRGQDYLRSEQGRAIGHKVTDQALGAVRKVSPKHAAQLDGVGRAAHDFIDRQRPSGPTIQGKAE
ncbi:MAG: hypothetical protein Q4G43_16440 [Mobilicoccus sp.]|nr:hypothetical protein [Mobilicoccus sp.]